MLIACPVFDAPRPMIEAPLSFSASVLVGFASAFSWFFVLCFEASCGEHVIAYIWYVCVVHAESKLLAELDSSLLDP